MQALWGIDLGGTKIEGALLRGQDLLYRKRIDTEAEQGYQHILSRIKLLVQQLQAEHKEAPKIIGFGTPGILDPKTQLMKNCNTTCLNGMPLKQDLQSLLGVECRLANDANCFALAEARCGAGKGASSVFGVILGTGVGAGVVIEGKLHQGAQGIAGEWGHNQLDPNGAQCYCGKKGCVEKVICGPALEARYVELGGKRSALTEIYTRFKAADDPLAKELIDELCSNFAKALSVVINILDPHIVVLGGGVSNIEELYANFLPLLRPYIFNDRVETKLVRNQLGDSAGVLGAAWLCSDR